MKKFSLFVVLLLSFSLFSKEIQNSVDGNNSGAKQYGVGQVCDDISWTDSNGLSTSIYDQTSQGKAVFIFWGSDG